MPTSITTYKGVPAQDIQGCGTNTTEQEYYLYPNRHKEHNKYHKTRVQCGDVKVEKKIDEKIEQFISWVQKHRNKKSLVAIR
ncbi:hypothetical protein QYF36_002980 [Acer negundo]|nr:hypothetical protein QYF36_002980 [Acer negundo]